MDLNNFIGLSIDMVLEKIKRYEPVVTYAKLGDSEFIEVPEKGYYVQANDGTGIISEYRIYFEEHEEFLPAPESTRGRYFKQLTIKDMENLLGSAIKKIRSVNIPGGKPTMAGKAFVDGDSKIIVYSNDGENVTCLHRKPLHEEANIGNTK